VSRARCPVVARCSATSVRLARQHGRVPPSQTVNLAITRTCSAALACVPIVRGCTLQVAPDEPLSAGRPRGSGTSGPPVALPADTCKGAPHGCVLTPRGLFVTTPMSHRRPFGGDSAHMCRRPVRKACETQKQKQKPWAWRRRPAGRGHTRGPPSTDPALLGRLLGPAGRNTCGGRCIRGGDDRTAAHRARPVRRRTAAVPAPIRRVIEGMATSLAETLAPVLAH